MKRNNIDINVVSAPCGAGKTFAICKKIAEDVDGKYLIVVPTLKLSEQYQKALEKENVEFINSVNSSKNPGESVSARIQKKIKDFNDNGLGGAVIITQAALNSQKFIPNKGRWNLILDEIPGIDNVHQYVVPYNHKFITNFIEIDSDFEDENPSKLKLIDKPTNELLSRANDEFDGKIKKLVADMHNNGHESFVNKANWKKIVEDNEVTPDHLTNPSYENEKNTITIVTMLSPKIIEEFKSVTIMGANFEYSMLFKWWGEYYGIAFYHDNSILNSLRFRSHTNGDRLKIFYLMESNFSKTQRNKITEEIIDNIECPIGLGDKLAKMAISILKDGFIYAVNNDFDNVELKNAGEKIAVISHGMNEYDDYNKAYFGAALNKKPAHNRILNDLGFDNQYIKSAHIVEVAYQFLMRSSLRKHECHDDVIFVVNDEYTARAIAELFPGCSVAPADGLIVKDAPFNSHERTKRSIASKLIATGHKGKVVDFVSYMSQISTNNIVKSGEKSSMIKSDKIWIENDLKVVSVNFKGELDRFYKMCLNRKITGFAYSSHKVSGYTAGIIVKSDYAISNMNEIFTFHDLMPDGNYFFVPSYTSGQGKQKMVKANCTQKSMDKCNLSPSLH